MDNCRKKLLASVFSPSITLNNLIIAVTQKIVFLNELFIED